MIKMFEKMADKDIFTLLNLINFHYMYYAYKLTYYICFSACVAAVKCRPVRHHCVVNFVLVLMDH